MQGLVIIRVAVIIITVGEGEKQLANKHMISEQYYDCEILEQRRDIHHPSCLRSCFVPDSSGLFLNVRIQIML